MSHAIRPPSAPMRAAIYVRVSTEDQAREGTSLDSQAQRCTAWIAAKGWELVGEPYRDEGVSGRLDSRPALDRLMADAHAGSFDVVVVLSIDRFGRTARHLLARIEELEAAGVAFVSVNESIDGSTPSGRFQRTVLAAVANLDADNIKERTTRGRRSTALEGGWPGGTPPFGLARRRDKGDKHSRLVVDEGEAHVIRTAAALVVDEGCDPGEAAARLNALGLTPRNGGRWTGAGIKRVLRADHLSGVWTYRMTGEAVTLAVPAVVDPDRHAAVRAALGEIRAVPQVHDFYLLSRGRLSAPCGARYRGMPNARDRGQRLYTCAGKRGGCECRKLDAEQVEAAVWEGITDLLAQPERLVQIAERFLTLRGEQIGVERAQTDTLDRKIAELERALTATLVDYAKRGLPAEAVEAASSALREELEALRRHRAQVARWQAGNARESGHMRRLWELAEVAHARLGAMSASEQARVLAMLDVKVSVRGWSDCGTCQGTGKLPGRRGGYRCGDCRGLRRLPALRVEGTVMDRLADALRPAGGSSGDFARKSATAS